VIFSGDKGMCGSFNSNIMKRAFSFLETLEDREVLLQPVGRKGRDLLRRKKMAIRTERVDVFRQSGLPGSSGDLAMELMDRYASRRARCGLPRLQRIQVGDRPEGGGTAAADRRRETVEQGEALEDYIYEPSAQALFDRLLPRHVEVQVYRVLLESAAAEQAARMTAMDAATNNAGELIESLTLHMNRVRQASITTEIIEIVSGAEALLREQGRARNGQDRKGGPGHRSRGGRGVRGGSPPGDLQRHHITEGMPTLG
jgi:F-type H+-transporting ATPase subunit gamma